MRGRRELINLPRFSEGIWWAMGMRTQAGPSASTSTSDRLFRKWALRSGERTGRAPCACLVGFSGEERLELTHLLSEFDIDVVQYLPDGSSLRGNVDFIRFADYLMILLESFASIECAVEELMQLRSSLSDVRTILVSKESRVDDLGDERRAICDATLYWPVSHLRLRAYLEKIAV